MGGLFIFSQLMELVSKYNPIRLFIFWAASMQILRETLLMLYKPCSPLTSLLYIVF